MRWKVKLPGQGSATPVIWGDSIFIQTAIPTGKTADGAPVTAAAEPEAPPPGTQPGERRRRMEIPKPTEVYQFVLMCLDRTTGKTRWQKVAREEVPHEGHHKDHGFASHSPVTDGQHIWAFFGSRGLHCFDMDGNLKWAKDLGKMTTRLSFGEGCSPALHGDTIVVLWDHEGEDFVAAFHKNTGEELWRVPRDEETTWATPLIVEHDGQVQVITTATKKVRSYDLATGQQVWEAPGLTPNSIPTPVAGDGMVFVTSGFRGSVLYAIRLGKTGDLTGTDAIAWHVGKGTPYVPSPLLYGDRLYLYSSNKAILSCFDAKTGKILIDTQRLDDVSDFYASPVGAAGKIYMPSRNGTTLVIKHLDKSDKFEVLATNVLADRFDASPAIVGKEIFLRGNENLYCIAE